MNLNQERTKKRYEAFWANEIADRCLIAIEAPKNGRQYVKKPPVNQEECEKYWCDGETILKRNRAYFEQTYFGGDAYPRIIIDLAAAGHAGFFKGVTPNFQPDTVWLHSTIKDINEELIFDANSFSYKKSFELLEYLTSEQNGDYMLGLPHIVGDLDALAHIRGSEALLLDMLMQPESVHKALAQIRKVWLDSAKKFFSIVEKCNMGGHIVGFGTWAPGKHHYMQCDMAAMFSADMFKEFIIPELTQQTQFLDYNLYHLDGQEQVRHLDHLLDLDGLMAIQWQDVACQPRVSEQIPVLKRIQNAGKRLLLYPEPDEVETIMKELSSKGLYLKVKASSVKEAKDIEKLVSKLTHE